MQGIQKPDSLSDIVAPIVTYPPFTFAVIVCSTVLIIPDKVCPFLRVFANILLMLS